MRPRFRVLIVGHFANAGKVEFGKVGCDGSIKVGLDPENAGKDFVEFALIRIALVCNVVPLQNITKIR